MTGVEAVQPDRGVGRPRAFAQRRKTLRNNLKGLADEANGVQTMKPMPELDALLAKKEKELMAV